MADPFATTSPLWRRDPLGEYVWTAVKGHLTRYAEAVWIYGGPKQQLTRQLLVPHWKTCLAVIRRWDAAGTEILDVEVALLGPVSKARWNDETQNLEIVAIRLHAEAVGPLLGWSPFEMAGVDMVRLSGMPFDGIRRHAEDQSDAAEIAAMLTAAIAHLAADSRDIDPLVAMAARNLRHPYRNYTVAEICTKIDIPERSLRRKFRQQLGIGPKLYARQSRLKHVLLEADRLPNPRWTDLALDFGYFDQAHLLEDVRQMTGMGLSRLHALRRNQTSALKDHRLTDCPSPSRSKAA